MSKVEQLITEHIDIWTSAILAKSTAGRGGNKKYELYGIKKLRELILELAVRGKLVPQDPADESASVLLEKIAVAKAKLITQGKIKKVKPLPKITTEEINDELPAGWEAIRLGDAMNVLNGRAYKKNEMLQEGTPLLRVGNLFTSNQWYYSNLDLEPEKYIDKGDLIYAWSASFGPFIWEGDKVIYHYHIWKLDLYDEVSLVKEYVYNYLLSITEKIKASGSGIAMLHMTKDRMEKLLLHLPPVSEQKRIVAKIDELMLLCDQLEQQTETSIDAHSTLVEVLLATLTDSADANELAQNWARVSEHFATLFTTEQSIEALKQTLLQLAVMGKLVPQDPDDEPAAILLEKIAAEKAQLIKDKKIKKEKPLPPIGDDEKPFELPVGWEWVRLANVSTVGTGGTPSRAVSGYWESKDISWVTSGETSESFIFATKEKVSNLAVQETNVSVYPPGTLIIAMYGQGKTRGQVSELMIDAGTNQACAAIRLIQSDVKHRSYIKLFFLKSYDEIRSHAAGGAQPNLNVGKISSTVIPLPPLTEQHRIVTKVDELMGICEQLKTDLQQSQKTQVQLTDALVDQALV